MRKFIPVAFAFVAFTTVAAGSALASGLTPADHQFVNAQGLTDAYAASAKPVATSARLVLLTNAERVIIDHQQEKFGN